MAASVFHSGSFGTAALVTQRAVRHRLGCSADRAARRIQKQQERGIRSARSDVQGLQRDNGRRF